MAPCTATPFNSKVMLFNANGPIVTTISDSVAGYLSFFTTVATIGGEKMTSLSVWIGDALEINVQIQTMVSIILISVKCSRGPRVTLTQ